MGRQGRHGSAAFLLLRAPQPPRVPVRTRCTRAAHTCGTAARCAQIAAGVGLGRVGCEGRDKGGGVCCPQSPAPSSYKRVCDQLACQWQPRPRWAGRFEMSDSVAGRPLPVRPQAPCACSTCLSSSREQSGQVILAALVLKQY